MNGFSRSLYFTLILSAGLILLSSCVTVQKPVLATFENQSPAFSVSYPSNWVPRELKKSEVLSVWAPQRVPALAVNIIDIPKGMKLSDSPRVFIKAIKNIVPKSSRHKVLSENIMTLNDGTKASESIISWRWVDRSTMLLTSYVTVFKDNKLIAVTCTSVSRTPVEVLKKVTHSLQFK
jgi:hypothetical protein